ncbi:D-lactate dehydrogenase [Kluyvera cryocrescens]|uniref:D-lactate dehydrogenase n=1 Tax=Kluyvera cryocrescens TaxID=580 RepID=A0A485A2P0_KLUCR|nr:D-lactate dehydrogenase [Kluyvera cryocrescens]
MKIAVYSTKQYDKKYLQNVNEAYGFELEFFDFLLTEKNRQNRARLRSGLHFR